MSGVSGQLRIAMGDDLTISANATHKAYEVIVWGLGETLTRVSHDGKLVAWLAKSIRNLDLLTWQVRLRDNAEFWDGSPVTAEAVAQSFQKNWTVQADVDSLISNETCIRVVNRTTLEFRTPEPTGNFPNALAYHQFVVHKSDGAVMTGPYRPVDYQPGKVLELEAFPLHWSGCPPIERIIVQVISDTAARIRALEDDEVDLAYGLPPEALSRFGDGYEITSIPSKKLHFIQFNHTRPPFDDRDVREATSLALDRVSLLEAALAGHGAVATSVFPPYAGVGVAPIQSGDVERAERLLDQAGWVRDRNGLRHKGTERLACTLYSFPQRREMTRLAQAVASQLGPVGYDVTVQEVPNIVQQTKDGDFSASMRSINSLVTGDSYFLLRAMLGKGGRSNQGGYFNPEVEQLLGDLRVETDPGARQRLSLQIQETQRHDVSNVFLLFTPIVMVRRRGRLAHFEPDWNNEYIIKSDMSVA
ncbi:ABC transporter substrate-binding protein [Actinopolymorpha alba]|uniref:ABC transporter substrate-binding protein n=1 Tax=Actinopolymorpha alba TaxID=533267 RepID=UPI0012F65AFD|nr:ABC transporter substrate-binding protein [Actinopolymorpha alba]